jgi:hypothetical protein
LVALRPSLNISLLLVVAVVEAPTLMVPETREVVLADTVAMFLVKTLVVA